MVGNLNDIHIKMPEDVTIKNIDNVKETVDGKLQKTLNENQKIVLDFQRVQIIDSTGIIFLIKVCRRLQEKGCLIKTNRISNEISSILDIFGVDELLKLDQ